MASNKYVLNKDADVVAECFAAHYTNIFLIHLYDQACKYAGTSSSIPNITEGYKTAISAYNNAMSRPDFTSVSVTGVYHQFLKLDKTMRRSECIHKILGAYFPEDGFQGIIKHEKFIECAMSKIVHDTTKQILCSVPVNHIKNIIDRNLDNKTTQLMQNDFRDITLELMERNHIDYINKKKAQYHNPDTNYSMFEKVKTELAKVNSEKSELEAKLSVMQKQMSDLQLRNHDLMEKTGGQLMRIKELETRTPPLQQQPYNPPAAQIHNTQPVTAPPRQNGLVQTGQLAPQYLLHEPQKQKRDYSHVLSDSDNDDDEPAPKQELISHVRVDDEYNMNLDMFNK